METIIKSIIPFFGDIWPYVAYALIAAVVSEVFEKKIIPLWNGAKFGIWPRRLQSIFPIIVGALIAPIFNTTVEDIALRCLAFAGAGAVGVFLFDILRAWFNKKGIKINLPGLNDDISN